MPPDSYKINYPPPSDRLGAFQQRLRRRGDGLKALRARNFHDLRGTAADLLNHVVIFDRIDQRLAGPMSVEDAEAWVEQHDRKPEPTDPNDIAWINAYRKARGAS